VHHQALHKLIMMAAGDDDVLLLLLLLLPSTCSWAIELFSKLYNAHLLLSALRATQMLNRRDYMLFVA
jgi:hypothetical protein